MVKKSKRSIYRSNNRKKWMVYFTQRYGKPACCRCGYDHSFYGLDFHHLDPSAKEFKISEIMREPITEKRKRELDNCIILCANCHAKEHANLKGETKYKIQKKRWLPILKEIYLTVACVKCGLDDFDQLVFHHIDSSTKLFKLSTYLGNYAPVSEEIITMVKLEGKKCIPLCRNCHQEHHEKERDKKVKESKRKKNKPTIAKVFLSLKKTLLIL
jgi:5-methylcytosine-specific restriction endonuclease McrA